MGNFEKVNIGNATLYCGDAFEILPTLDDEKIDLVCSDPPNHLGGDVPLASGTSRFRSQSSGS